MTSKAEVWKSINVSGYPITMDPYSQDDPTSAVTLRPRPTRVFNDSARLQISKSTFIIDSARLWNQAPQKITMAPTLSAAKAAILEYVKLLPI